MQLTLRDNLPFVTVTLAYQDNQVTVPNVLIDTGSARSIFSADTVSSIQIAPAPDDVLIVIRGIGGTEVVFTRLVDYIQLGERRLSLLEIEVGSMDYGLDIQGILGMDFLQEAGVILNLAVLEITFV